MPRKNNFDLLDYTMDRWGALGAGVDAGGARDPPDLERLILAPARCAHRSARLVTVAVTWLDAYADLVATHRLRRLVRDELAPERQPALGFLLDCAQQDHHQPSFATITSRLDVATSAEPLYEDQRTNQALVELAESRASEIAKKWGVWAQSVETKPDALRPAHWLLARHDTFLRRADFRGDLRASVLAALRFDADAGQSEVALARCAGGSRSQVRNALARLALGSGSFPMRLVYLWSCACSLARLKRASVFFARK